MKTSILIKCLLLMSVVCCCACYTCAGNYFDNYEIKELYDKGRCFYQNEKNDSALIYFHACGNRFDDFLSKEDKIFCVRSITQSARLYFFSYNYGKASEQILKVLDICNKYEMPEETARIYVEQGALLMTYATQKRDDKYYAQAVDAYRNAFWVAKEYGQWQTMITALINLCNRMHSVNKLNAIQKEVEAFKDCKDAMNEYNYLYASKLVEGLSYVEQGKYSEARDVFREQKSLLPYERKYFNLIYGSCASIVKTFVCEERYDSAIWYEHQMLELALKTGMKDGKAVALHDLAELYRLNGDTAKASEYRNYALIDKDSLLSGNNLDEVGALNILQQLNANENELDRRMRDNASLKVVILCILLVVVVGCIVWLGIRKKRDKKRSDENLTPSEKYVKSTLDEESKQTLKNRIQDVLDKSGEIYSTDFNLEQLSQLCESKPKYVSQVINQLFETNFSSLVNKYRIKEACRRIEDEQFDNFTLEAISSSVGFKSRATFHTVFKHFMGQTPGEYVKSVKRRKCSNS